MVYAWFIYREARPVDGISCCQWHVHAIAVNATFDAVENQWKALEMGNVKTDAPFYQAAFNSVLAEKLMASGYAIRRTGDDFELANVSRELIDKFSKRHAKIKELEVALETELEQTALTWSKKSGINYEKTLGKVKAELAKKSREKKSTALLKNKKLRNNWGKRMTPKECESLQIDKVKVGPSVGFLEAETAKELTLESLEEDHHFGTPDEKLSDVKDSPKRPKETRELHVAAALLRRGIGKVSLAAAKIWAHTMHLVTDSKARGAPKEAKTSERVSALSDLSSGHQCFWIGSRPTRGNASAAWRGRGARAGTVKIARAYSVAFLGKNCRAEKIRTKPRKGINIHAVFASGTDETRGSPLSPFSPLSGLSGLFLSFPANASAGRTKAAVTRAQTLRK
jgi:hypothetical protein